MPRSRSSMDGPGHQRTASTPGKASPASHPHVQQQSPQALAERPAFARAPHSNPNLTNLPPLMTNTGKKVSNTGARASSFAKHRLSTFSNASGFSSKSRPESYIFPALHSSLSYTIVRDFAYPAHQTLHYGPPPDAPSTVSTPMSETNRRLSDPPRMVWPGRGHWGPDTGAAFGLHTTSDSAGPRLPSTAYDGGPPYPEDDDLLSPVVSNVRHRKSRSKGTDYDWSRSHLSNGLGNAGFSYLSNSTTEEDADFTSTSFNPDVNAKSWQQRRAEEDEHAQPPPLHTNLSRTYTTRLPPAGHEDEEDSDDTDAYATHARSGSSTNHASYNDHDNRYSRDYQFTIASPDEEMAGKAVALFDFTREHENELPLVEGQVIIISYRHGQGWLVAQDPRTKESGLVPEDYVRLVRDIEGGLRGLNGLSDGDGDGRVYDEIDTPVLTAPTSSDAPVDEVGKGNGTVTATAAAAAGQGMATGGVDGQQLYAPMQSHFTTSSRDLEPYPASRLLGSQMGTPVASSSSYGHGHGPESATTTTGAEGLFAKEPGAVTASSGGQGGGRDGRR